jgi:hypothetical protein
MSTSLKVCAAIERQRGVVSSTQLHNVPHEVTWHLTEHRIEALTPPADAEPV